jgi:hypothetical protein
MPQEDFVLVLRSDLVNFTQVGLELMILLLSLPE